MSLCFFTNEMKHKVKNNMILSYLCRVSCQLPPSIETGNISIFVIVLVHSSWLKILFRILQPKKKNKGLIERPEALIKPEV